MLFQPCEKTKTSVYSLPPARNCSNVLGLSNFPSLSNRIKYRSTKCPGANLKRSTGPSMHPPRSAKITTQVLRHHFAPPGGLLGSFTQKAPHTKNVRGVVVAHRTGRGRCRRRLRGRPFRAEPGHQPQLHPPWP